MLLPAAPVETRKRAPSGHDGPPRKRPPASWEDQQAAHALHVVPHDEIFVPGSAEYRFVFDDLQAIDFYEETAAGNSPEPHLAHATPAAELRLAHAASIAETRRLLPVYAYRQQLLEAVAANQFLVVVGETGSGKTTQLPQYLHEAGYTSGGRMVGCTQPRQVAATLVALRVADEVGCAVGSTVGYAIRFDNRSGKDTVIKYMTDGMLLREFLADPLLLRYLVLMVDEAHERTLHTDILLGLIKGIAKQRPELRVVVALATMNAAKFSTYFNDAPVFTVPGRRFPVAISYTKQPEANYLHAAITTVFQVHAREPPGDVLVFLTGQEEIESMAQSLAEACAKMGDSGSRLVVAPIYANLPPELQKRIFDPTPPGCRKVVLATNIAETSITIDGIVYVVDCGLVKENTYNPNSGMELLTVGPCSQALADQRAGRAGRVAAGKCFRLYTKWAFHHDLPELPTPEILRTNLASVVLLLLLLGVSNLIRFDFMDLPLSSALILAFKLLYALGALTGKGQLTKTGRMMAELPIDPMMAKLVIHAKQYGAVLAMVLVAAIVGELLLLFYRPKDKREQADRARDLFKQPGGDHLMLLEVWDRFEQAEFLQRWCREHFLQYKSLIRAKNVRLQLVRLCQRLGIWEEHGSGVEGEQRRTAVAKLITAGYFAHCAKLSRLGLYQSVKRQQPVFLHPSSTLFRTKPPPKMVLYHELVLTSKEYMRTCLVVEHRWLRELAPHYYRDGEVEPQ